MGNSGKTLLQWSEMAHDRILLYNVLLRCALLNTTLVFVYECQYEFEDCLNVLHCLKNKQILSMFQAA